jgi:hypothetical protein
MGGASDHMPRQVDGLSLGDVCFEMKLEGSELSAMCVAQAVVPVSTRIDLDQCLTNDRGVLGFDSRYELECRVHLCRSTFQTS